MVKSRPIVTLVLIWLAWALMLGGFQSLVTGRFGRQPSDEVLAWTGNETGRTGQRGKPYLLDPFLNEHVSWDSEFYLSIATYGYDDPNLRALLADGSRPYPLIPKTGLPYGVSNAGAGGQAGGPQAASPTGAMQRYVSLNYAFFPLYPYAMRVAGFVLRPLGLDAIATATLAGVLISLLGTLAAMLALYDLARERLGEDGGIRAAFYLLIFPTGFFLAQVYTEGLFLGLAFASLALVRRRWFFPAALLAALATLTRAVGVALVIPLGLAWLNEWRAACRRSLVAPVGVSEATMVAESAPALALAGPSMVASPVVSLSAAAPLVAAASVPTVPVAASSAVVSSAAADDAGRNKMSLANPAAPGRARAPRAAFYGLALHPWPTVLRALLAALPLLVFIAWRLSPWGANFQFVEDRFFGRGVLLLGRSLAAWAAALAALAGNNPQSSAYYLLELATVVVALIACLATLRRYPGPALFGLAVLAISLTSGAAQSLNRYVLAVPSIFIFLAQVGRARAFDRGWTIASGLAMGLLATLFSLDMWVG